MERDGKKPRCFYGREVRPAVGASGPYGGNHESIPTGHDSIPTDHDFIPTDHDSIPTDHDSIPIRRRGPVALTVASSEGGLT